MMRWIKGELKRKQLSQHISTILKAQLMCHLKPWWKYQQGHTALMYMWLTQACHIPISVPLLTLSSPTLLPFLLASLTSLSWSLPEMSNPKGLFCFWTTRLQSAQFIVLSGNVTTSCVDFFSL